MFRTGDCTATLDPMLLDIHGQHIQSYPAIISALREAMQVRRTIFTPLALVTRDPAGETLSRIMTGYKASIAPTGVKVGVGLTIKKLGDVREQTQTFQLSGWMHTTWNDPRLTYQPWDLVWLHSISINEGMVWDPRVSIDEAVPESLKSVPAKSGGVQMWILPGGRIKKSVWFSTKIGCQMHLSKFPNDEQICTVTAFSPMGLPVSINGSRVKISGKQPLFSIKAEFKTTISDSNSTHMVITFRRKTLPYFMSYVIPSMM